mmetsp:Transcript_135661/g.351703  ORF Transcript_135661/g.351703 Transcript_135661/m.351703 type:complete len:111 (+) Transcript_135661:24-356(+)
MVRCQPAGAADRHGFFWTSHQGLGMPASRIATGRRYGNFWIEHQCYPLLLFNVFVVLFIVFRISVRDISVFRFQLQVVGLLVGTSNVFPDSITRWRLPLAPHNVLEQASA